MLKFEHYAIIASSLYRIDHIFDRRKVIREQSHSRIEMM